MKIKYLLNSLICLFMLCNVHAEESKKVLYGEAGGFELSTGLSVASTSNQAFSQNYSIGLFPYANHFLFKNWFLRYDLGFVYQYSILHSSVPQFAGQYSEVWSLSVNPGLGAGYSFELNDRWRFNFSGGYQYGYVWTSSNYFGSYGFGGGNIVFSPELKFLVTTQWILTILSRVNTNLVDLMAGTSRHPIIATNTYIVASYYFP